MRKGGGVLRKLLGKGCGVLRTRQRELQAGWDVMTGARVLGKERGGVGVLRTRSRPARKSELLAGLLTDAWRRARI